VFSIGRCSKYRKEPINLHAVSELHKDKHDDILHAHARTLMIDFRFRLTYVDLFYLTIIL